jgi:metal-dependent hydrolase (beta-lactamase superfamily II)
MKGRLFYRTLKIKAMKKVKILKFKAFVPLLVLVFITISSCTQQKKIDVTYIANAGFLIESSGKQIIIDALFKQGWDNYLIPEDSIVTNIITQQPPFNNSNLMLITHDHADHFNASMVVACLINNPEIVLIAPPKKLSKNEKLTLLCE